MIIAMPVDGNSMEASVNRSFGRTGYFMFYDTEAGEAVFKENSAAMAQGGAGIQAAQFVVDNGAKVVIAPMLGKNAADVLVGAGMKLYRNITPSIQENINDFIADRLSPLTQIHAGFHNHGG